MRSLILALLTLALTAPGVAAEVPRFVSLKAAEVNVRQGPSERHKIKWVLQRRALPVRVVEEHEVWRRVVDHEGGEGWIHTRLLAARRTVMVTGAIRRLYREPNASAAVLLRAEPGVIGELRGCAGVWCEVEIADTRGYIPRAHVWGVLDDNDAGS